VNALDREGPAFAALSWLLPILVLVGCVHQHDVTMRPEFAFPQNLISLCDRDSRLVVSNRGEFFAPYQYDGTQSLLLSAQLSTTEPATQRLVSDLALHFSVTDGLEIVAVEGGRSAAPEFIPLSRMHCGSDGEMLLDYPEHNFYFWASIGEKQRTVALWTNALGDLVIQNRWREQHRGLISGTVTGDAWALFKASNITPHSPAPLQTSGRETEGLYGPDCEDLSGRYLPAAEVVHADGSLNSRLAVDQFFREELVGKHPVNQGDISATELRIEQAVQSGIRISLYNGESLLGSRDLAASSLSCKSGRWLFEGETSLHSAWLLLAASAGVSWEDLTLWRDRVGALLVEGRYVQRSVLMFIPFGGTETLFMAFPPAP